MKLDVESKDEIGQSLGPRCYICTTPCSLDEIERTNRYFDEADIEEYAFLIEHLGLHHCSGPEELFHRGTTNVCAQCLHRALRAFLSPLILPLIKIESQGARIDNV